MRSALWTFFLFLILGPFSVNALGLIYTPSIVIKKVVYLPVDQNRESDVLSIKVCNEGPADYSKKIYGSLVFRVTINKIKGYMGSDKDILNVGDCHSFTMTKFMGESSPFHTLQKGDYEMEIALLDSSWREKNKFSYWAHFDGINMTITPNSTVLFSGFKDVSASSSTYDAIMYLKKNDIVGGFSDGTFRPDTTISRSEFTKIIILSYFPKIEREMSGCFSYKNHPQLPHDVKDDWSASYICMAIIKGLVAGYPDGTFRQDKPISFVETAKILSRLFLDTPQPLLNTSEGQWFEGYVRDMEKAAAIPVSVQRFNQAITRGEMAEMVYRLKEHITSKKSVSYSSLAIKSGISDQQFSALFPRGWTFQRIPDMPFEIPLPANAGFAKSKDGTSDVYPLPEQERTSKSPYSFFLSFKLCEPDAWCQRKYLHGELEANWKSTDRRIDINFYTPSFSFEQYLFSIETPDYVYFAKFNDLKYINTLTERTRAQAAASILRNIRLVQN